MRREAPVCSAAIGIGVKTSSNERPGGIRERGHHEIVAAGPAAPACYYQTDKKRNASPTGRHL